MFSADQLEVVDRLVGLSLGSDGEAIGAGGVLRRVKGRRVVVGRAGLRVAADYEAGVSGVVCVGHASNVRPRRAGREKKAQGGR